eukprot:CAMPEP_0172388452 /NCGR_PEP_ID=MMETSP1061-20121228/5565_1 /TAXON_ID=37318 /ORGANISM="Pseudo-nitzschia pungens, Strain cf. pungens" /LENGTH=33 /DNA_ID= /DNA_START= /DNA_END= /DNA_ORIENTATION=
MTATTIDAYENSQPTVPGGNGGATESVYGNDGI